MRVAVLHHHLASSPWRALRKRPVARRSDVLHALAGAGAELILSGHIHQAAVYERHEFEVLDDDDGARTVLAGAPGFGRPRPHRLGEARGLHVHEIDDDAIVVRTYLWTRGTSRSRPSAASYARRDWWGGARRDGALGAARQGRREAR